MNPTVTSPDDSTAARRAGRGDRPRNKAVQTQPDPAPDSPRFVAAQPKLAKVKAGIANKPMDQAVAIFQTHRQMMAGNPNFPTPDPPVADYDTALATLERDLIYLDELKAAIADAYVQRDRAYAEMCNLFNMRVGYVESAARGDESKILSSGMGVRKPRSRTGQLPAPLSLVVTRSAAVDGRLIIQWGAVKKSRTYLLQYCEADAGERDWKHHIASTRRRLEINGLTGGMKYAFRVSALGGSTGQSDWSTEVQMRVPGWG